MKKAKSKVFNEFIQGYEFDPAKILDINSSDNQESISMTNHIIEEFNTRISREFNEKLKVYLKKNLADRGFEFASQEEFYKFATNRVHRVVFEKEQEVHYYIDFIDLENRGVPNRPH